MSQRYQTEILEKKLMPVFQSEVWPIIQTESEPLVSEISREIWNEVSVFGFGWRYLYDRTPLPKKDLAEKKFKQFVDEKAKPIIAAHLDEVLELQKEIVGKVAKNEKVKLALNESVRAATSDPEFARKCQTGSSHSRNRDFVVWHDRWRNHARVRQCASA